MLYTDNNGRTSALPFIVAGMILLLICAAGCGGGGTAKKEAESKTSELLELTIEDVKFRFRWCPAGTFEMGSRKQKEGIANNSIWLR
ncbi:MAG: hypothetical protein LBT89_09205 [Planctomycetaceae bacterium]|nr:hypothetical protein [Planctomycetaceae bacterium]